MPKVLIADKLSEAAVAIFHARGIEADVRTGLPPAELRAVIGEYDGLAVRSASKVTRELLDVAARLKVVGRRWKSYVPSRWIWCCPISGCPI